MKFTSLFLYFITFQLALSLPAELQVLQTLGLESFNATLDARSFHIPPTKTIRAQASIRPPLTPEAATRKGNDLLCRFQVSSLGADQSPYTTPQQVEGSGWVRSDHEASAGVLAHLTQIFQQENIPNVDGTVGAFWSHEGASQTKDHEIAPASDADYTNLFNPRVGFIVSESNYGPNYMLQRARDKVLPDVRAWSDVVFVEWQTQAGLSGTSVGNLNYVLRYEVENAESQKMIKLAAAGKAGSLEWPGVVIPMTDGGGKAVLGSPNGRGVGYLLTSHKAALGDRAVESVRVWTENTLYYALFKIVPVGGN